MLRRLINPIEEKSTNKKEERIKEETCDIKRLIFGQNKVFRLFLETEFCNVVIGNWKLVPDLWTVVAN